MATTPQLTDEEKRQYDMKRTSMFKGTIAVIIIYASLLTLLSLIGIFSPVVREIVFSTGFPFIVTFITGVVLVIIMLLIQVLTYKVTPKQVIPGENLTCPEYWELEQTPESELKNIKDPAVKSLSTYRCVNTRDTTANTTYLKSTTIAGTTTTANKLKSVADNYNTDNLYISCARLYPEYMAFVDKQEFPNAPTSLRCEYIKQCKDGIIPPNNTTAQKVIIDWPTVCP